MMGLSAGRRHLKNLEGKNEKPKSIEWEWKIWKIWINTDQIKYVKLDEDNFFDIIMELTNG